MEASPYNKNRLLAYNTSVPIACATNNGLQWFVIAESANTDPTVGSPEDENPLMASMGQQAPSGARWMPWPTVNGVLGKNEREFK